jgi:hypothetical protein
MRAAFTPSGAGFNLSRDGAPGVFFELFDAAFLGFEQPQPLLCVSESRRHRRRFDRRCLRVGTPTARSHRQQNSSTKTVREKSGGATHHTLRRLLPQIRFVDGQGVVRAPPAELPRLELQRVVVCSEAGQLRDARRSFGGSGGGAAGLLVLRCLQPLHLVGAAGGARQGTILGNLRFCRTPLYLMIPLAS